MLSQNVNIGALLLAIERGKKNANGVFVTRAPIVVVSALLCSCALSFILQILAFNIFEFTQAGLLAMIGVILILATGKQSARCQVVTADLANNVLVGKFRKCCRFNGFYAHGCGTLIL